MMVIGKDFKVSSHCFAGLRMKRNSKDSVHSIPMYIQVPNETILHHFPEHTHLRDLHRDLFNEAEAR